MSVLNAAGSEVGLAYWHSAHRPEVIGGSLYAVDPSLRQTAAQTLHRAGSRIHVTSAVASAAIAAGASYLVSGRALLTSGNQSDTSRKRTTDE